MATSNNNPSILVLLLGALPLLAGGCNAPEEVALEDTRDWMQGISDGDAPATCDRDEAVHGVDCHGEKCAYVSILCTDVTPPHTSSGDHEWTSEFSSDGRDDEGNCGSGDWWVTGVECVEGTDHCGELRLRCTEFPNTAPSPGDCEWSGTYSQESPHRFVAPWRHYLKAMDCTGRDCDNKRYKTCRMW